MSEGQVVFGRVFGRGGCLAVAVDDDTEIVSAMEQSFGEFGDGIAVMLHLAMLVAEQVGISSEEGHAHDVKEVTEDGERRQLGGVEQIDGSHGGHGQSRNRAYPATDGTGHARHRFLLAGRLGAWVGIWNTSK